MTKCEHCDTRLSEAEFQYNGHPLCCECMSELCSWFLDGGQTEDPERYEHLGIPV